VGGIFEMDGLLHLAKMMVSIFSIKIRMQVEMPRHMNTEVMHPKIQNKQISK